MSELWDKISEDVDAFSKENEKLSPLLEEINLIEDSAIKSFTKAMLLSVDIFWEAPSSPTGQYHPPDEHGAGGEVLHTQRVVKITSMLCESMERDQYETDMLISAALLHDLTKVREWAPGIISSDPLHPITVYTHFQNLRQTEEDSIDEMGSSTLELDMNTIDRILRLVRCHLGPWSPIPEVVPLTPFEMTVHWADYIASKLHEIVDMDG